MTWQTVEWDVEPLWQQLEPLLPGLSVEVVARCDSTNTQLLDRARGRGDAGLRRHAADRQPCLLVFLTSPVVMPRRQLTIGL